MNIVIYKRLKYCKFTRKRNKLYEKKIVLKCNIRTTNIEHKDKSTGTSIKTVSFKPSFGLVEF